MRGSRDPNALVPPDVSLLEKDRKGLIQDEVGIFLKAERRRRLGMMFIGHMAKRLEGLCIDCGNAKDLLGRPLRQELVQFRSKLILSQDAFMKADEGFIQSYMISLARRAKDSVLWGKPPSRTTEELWKDLDDGDQKMRDILTQEYQAINARIGNTVELDDLTWLGLDEDQADCKKLHSYIFGKLVDMNLTASERTFEMEDWNSHVQHFLKNMVLEEIPSPERGRTITGSEEYGSFIPTDIRGEEEITDENIETGNVRVQNIFEEMKTSRLRTTQAVKSICQAAQSKDDAIASLRRRNEELSQCLRTIEKDCETKISKIQQDRDKLIEEIEMRQRILDQFKKGVALADKALVKELRNKVEMLERENAQQARRLREKGSEISELISTISKMKAELEKTKQDAERAKVDLTAVMQKRIDELKRQISTSGADLNELRALYENAQARSTQGTDVVLKVQSEMQAVLVEKTDVQKECERLKEKVTTLVATCDAIKHAVGFKLKMQTPESRRKSVLLACIQSTSRDLSEQQIKALETPGFDAALAAVAQNTCKHSHEDVQDEGYRTKESALSARRNNRSGSVSLSPRLQSSDSAHQQESALSPPPTESRLSLQMHDIFEGSSVKAMSTIEETNRPHSSQSRSPPPNSQFAVTRNGVSYFLSTASPAITRPEPGDNIRADAENWAATRQTGESRSIIDMNGDPSATEAPSSRTNAEAQVISDALRDISTSQTFMTSTEDDLHSSGHLKEITQSIRVIEKVVHSAESNMYSLGQHITSKIEMQDLEHREELKRTKALTNLRLAVAYFGKRILASPIPDNRTDDLPFVPEIPIAEIGVQTSADLMPEVRLEKRSEDPLEKKSDVPLETKSPTFSSRRKSQAIDDSVQPESQAVDEVEECLPQDPESLAANISVANTSIPKVRKPLGPFTCLPSFAAPASGWVPSTPRRSAPPRLISRRGVEVSVPVLLDKQSAAEEGGQDRLRTSALPLSASFAPNRDLVALFWQPVHIHELNASRRAERPSTARPHASRRSSSAHRASSRGGIPSRSLGPAPEHIPSQPHVHSQWGRRTAQGRPDSAAPQLQDGGGSPCWPSPPQRARVGANMRPSSARVGPTFKSRVQCGGEIRRPSSSGLVRTSESSGEPSQLKPHAHVPSTPRSVSGWPLMQ